VILSVSIDFRREGVTTYQAPDQKGKRKGEPYGKSRGKGIQKRRKYREKGLIFVTTFSCTTTWLKGAAKD